MVITPALSLSCSFPQVFSGQLPFPGNKTQDTIIKQIMGGERMPKPPGGKELGLSDELWRLIRSSWTRDVEKRPAASDFVDFLEGATPNIAVLKGLAEFDTNSEGDIQKLRHMFVYGANWLLGMREGETLVVVEVFDRVNASLNNPFTPLEYF